MADSLTSIPQAAQAAAANGASVAQQVAANPPTTVQAPTGTSVTPSFNLATSGFTPAQVTAYNNAAALAPKAPSSITSSSLVNNGSVTTPTPPSTPNYLGAVANGTSVIGANNGFIAPNPDTSGTNDLTNLFNQYLSQEQANKPPSGADLYNSLYSSSGVAQDQTNANAAQQAVTDATSNLNSINATLQGLAAQHQAANIDETNRLAPSFVISAAQAQQDKNYAIQVLPYQTQALTAQAQVAAAQGNATLANNILTQAQNQLDKVFQLQSQDMQNQYTYMQDQLKSVYDFATTQEQNILKQQQDQNQQAFTLYQNNLSSAQSVAQTAIKNGQSQLATQIAALDPNSGDFQSQLTALESQLKAPTSNQIIGGETTGYTNVKLDANGNVIGTTKITNGTGTTGGVSFTPTFKTALLGAGETSASIAKLASDIGQYGAQYVLDNGQGLSDATKQAIESEYNIQPTAKKNSGLFGWGFLGL